jgi:hypothetical protein
MVPGAMPPSPTFKAFRILYRAASPDLRDRALRHAIGSLVEVRSTRTAPPSTSLAPPSSSTTPQSAPPSRWESLRIRLRELGAADNPATRRQVAQALGLAESSLSRMLTPHHTGPGKAILDRAESWVERLHPEASENDERSIVVETERDDPHLTDNPKPNGKAVRREAEPPGGALCGPNGGTRPAKPAAARDPHKLTTEQREALTLLLSLDARGIRHAGVSGENARRAADGQAVPAEVIERLAAFLAR